MIIVAFLLLLTLAFMRRKRCVMQHNAYDLGFRKWAFGVTYDIPIPSLTAMMAWNSLHGDKLRLREDGIFAHDIGLMWDLYLQWQQEELDQQKPLTGQSNEGQ